MSQKLSEIPEEKREAERAKRKAYKARYRENMSAETRAAEAARNKAYKQAHREQIKKKRAEYTDRNRERIAAVKAEYDKKYYAENHLKIKARLKESKHWQLPKSKERIKKYEEDNKERLAQYRKEYYQKNREHKIKYSAEYYARNPEKVAIWRKNADPTKKKIHRINNKLVRKNRIEDAGKLSSDIVPRLMKLQKGKCRACGKPLKNDYHIDHITSLAKGGTNTDNNCQLLHSKCNLSKGARDPYEHAQRLGMLFM